MARVIHGPAKVSPGPAMLDPSMPCGRPTPETSLQLFLRPSSTPSDAPRCTGLHCLKIHSLHQLIPVHSAPQETATDTPPKKTFTCSHCEKSFTRKPNLIRHEKIHLGERPYQCPLCSKYFSQMTHLKKHQLTHDEKEKVDAMIRQTLNG
jgi:uncharacterized Zn-finger protein